MTLPDTAIRAKAREIADAWRNLIAAIESPSKWYTADELSERRAIPTEDGDLIAALSPANVAAFLDIIDALLSSGGIDGEPAPREAAEGERLRTENALLRDALAPFAAFREVEVKAQFGGTAIFPVKDFRLADFRRAKAALASPVPGS